MADAAVADWAGLQPGDAELLRCTLRLTIASRSMPADDLQPLRAGGMSHDNIHDVVHVVACFNSRNRLADGLGLVQGERGHAWARTLLRDDAMAAHLSLGSP